jgi:hypothetical protein
MNTDQILSKIFEHEKGSHSIRSTTNYHSNIVGTSVDYTYKNNRNVLVGCDNITGGVIEYTNSFGTKNNSASVSVGNNFGTKNSIGNFATANYSASNKFGDGISTNAHVQKDFVDMRINFKNDVGNIGVGANNDGLSINLGGKHGEISVSSNRIGFQFGYSM